MRLALFDLDHTLIPFDSGMAFMRFLVARGALPAASDAAYLEACRRFVAGQIDVLALHRALVLPLAAAKRGELDAWLADFDAALAPTLPPNALALVQAHRDAGDVCCLVTATTRLVAERYAAAFGIEELLATEAQRDSLGRLTGEVVGAPCVGAHKLDKLVTWLALQGHSLAGVAHSSFYSDSIRDLPLLEAVSEPVAVRPDAALRALAEQRGWRVIDSLVAD